MGQKHDHGVPEDLPKNLRSLWAQVELVPEEDLSDESNEVIEPARQGFCMTCHSPLGPTTVLLVNKHGICAAYCGGACMQDMAVLGWIQEEHDDIIDRVKFRGSAEADGLED